MCPLNVVTKDGNKKKIKHLQILQFCKRRDGHWLPAQLLLYCKIPEQQIGLVAFYYFLDTTRVNSRTLYWIKKGLDIKKQNKFDLRLELAKSLKTPFDEQRSMNGLGKSVIRKINYAFNWVLAPSPVDKIERAFSYSSY